MPRYGRQHGNACAAAEILELTPPPVTPAAPTRKRRSGESDRLVDPPTKSRLIKRDVKVLILKAYTNWLDRGSPRDGTIKNLAKEYEVRKEYPKDLYDKVLTKGCVDNQWHMAGRPNDIPEKVWEEMIKICRERRLNQVTASSKLVSAILKKRLPKLKTPSPSTVRNKKVKLGYHLVNVIRKPFLNTKQMKARLAFATEHVDRDWDTTIVIDEKWFSEEKVESQKIEVRKGSPAGKERFKPKQVETATQRTKIMFITAATATHKVLLEELDMDLYYKKHPNELKKGKKSGGVTAKFLAPILKKIAKKAKELIPNRPLSIQLDRATAHTAKDTQILLGQLFPGGVAFQVGKSPDTNMADAALYPFLERQCAAEGCFTKHDIRKTVTKLWKEISADTLGRCAERVNRNLRTIIRLKGGNFYNE